MKTENEPTKYATTGKKRKRGEELQQTDVKRLKEDITFEENQTTTTLSTPSSLSLSVNQIFDKISSGDRQMALRLLREFSFNHAEPMKINYASSLITLLKAACVTKFDQIASRCLILAYSLLSQLSKEIDLQLEDYIADKNVVDKLLSKANTIPYVLDIVSFSLSHGLLRLSTLPSRLRQTATHCLQSTVSRLRICALNFFSASIKGSSQSDLGKFEQYFSEMMSDRDARVRRAASDGLMYLNSAKFNLSLKTYDVLRNLVDDSDKNIRIASMRLILSFANRVPYEKVSESVNKSVDNVDLCDNAFSVICQGINDMEVSVRAEAATLLGQFSSVSGECLEQTLDKKLMRIVKTNRGNEVKTGERSLFALTKDPVRQRTGTRWKAWQQEKKGNSAGKPSEWASGKDLNAPCPSGEQQTKKEEEKDGIIPQGACGAFVSALEDEFMVVRKAAVYSLGVLAAHRPSFATSALDHLTDMFNDEIASVRLDAILALTPLVVHGQLQKEQLDIILKCLDDALFQSRQALRELLAKSEFADMECMKICTRALINCLQRFPGDRDQIFECMRDLGRNHCVFIHTMVSGLLDLHPIFEQKEQQIDDVYYQAKLLLVLNAASRHNPIVSLLPAYVLKHYRFLRASTPELVHAIEIVDRQTSIVNRQYFEVAKASSNHEEILLKTYERLCETNLEPSLSEKNILRRIIAEDANAICSFNANLAGPSRFLASLSEVCAVLDSVQESIVCGADLSGMTQALESEEIRVNCAINQFSFVDPLVTSFLLETVMSLNLLRILTELLLDSSVFNTVVDRIRNTVETFERNLEDRLLICSGQAFSLVKETKEMIDFSDPNEKKVVTAGVLGRILSQYSPILPSTFDSIESIRCKWAHITEPSKDAALEKTLKFVVGLPTSIPLAATLHNCSTNDLKNVRIKIDYPDDQTSYFKPNIADFVTIDDFTATLNTKVLLSVSAAWSDSGVAKLTVVLQTDAGLQLSYVPVLECPTSKEIASLSVRIQPQVKY